MKNKQINILSLFDGISCGQLALLRAYPKLKEIGYNYYASEIKPNAIRVTKTNFPFTKEIGNVKRIKGSDKGMMTEKGFFTIDDGIFLLIGGSPCQDLSFLGYITKDENMRGLNGDKSSLFFEYLRILKEVKPKYFILENVVPEKKYKELLDEYLGIEGIPINSRLVSYQNRPRCYWSNIPNIKEPLDRGVSFQDYIEKDLEKCKPYKLTNTKTHKLMWNDGKGKNSIKQCQNVTNLDKIFTISRRQDRSPNAGLVEFEDFCRFLTRRELEQGQTLPVGYTDILTYGQMQDVVGDGFTVDVISHLLSFIPEFQTHKI